MDRPFPFVYHISIHNDSDVTVTIRGRKWVVTEQDGTCVVVEGDGVVGKFPRLEPGERFSYSSYHVIASDSVVEGAYLAVIENGGAALARIPMFELKKPV
jgi:ApaG protein